MIAQAIADIEALNAERKTACSIIDHGWDEKRFKAVNKEAMASFDIVPTREKSAGSADGYGQSVVPVVQTKPSAVKELDEASAPSGEEADTWVIRD